MNDYRVNARRSLAVTERRLQVHLMPWFGGKRLATITTSDVRAYIVKRQADRTMTTRGRTLTLKDGTVKRLPSRVRAIDAVSNGEINRELTALKRIFSLAIQAGKILHKPHIPLLNENNVRRGFFELDEFLAVQRHLPAAVRPVIEFAYITGWRIPSEVLPLQWRQIDFGAGEVRLDPGSTKNGEARVFPFTDDLRRLLETQDAERRRLAQEGQIVPWVFTRLVAKGHGGPKVARRIKSITKAWTTATIAAGCPGRIPHDLRRTAVRTMVRRGVPERVAMALTGHKTRSIFERYNIVSPGDLKTAATHLNSLGTGTKKGQFDGPSLSREGETTRVR